MVSAEYQIKAIERALALERGEPLTEFTRTKEEQIRHQEKELLKERYPHRFEEEDSNKEINLENLEGQIFDSKGRPMFDKDGLSIDYDDEEEE